MIESGYYPPGAEYDPNAPYNQSDNDPVDVEVTISQTLSRNATIAVTDYTEEHWEDWETGDEGEIIHTKGTDYDFSESDLKEAYKSQEYDVPELLYILKSLLDKEINNTLDEKEKKRLSKIRECCKGWTVDEYEVVK